MEWIIAIGIGLWFVVTGIASYYRVQKDYKDK